MPTLAGKPVSQNGLGLMRLCMPQFAVPEAQTFAVLRAAVAAGTVVWNGADYYGTPENNALHLMNRYFTAYPEDADKVVLSVKSGLLDRRTMAMDVTAAGLRKAVDQALRILDGKKSIDVFGIARVDPTVPVEESVAALEELRREGKFTAIQLSEVRAETIRRAANVARIAMVEAEASLWSPYVFENGVAEVCGELGITLVAHTPLGMGGLGGQIRSLGDIPQDSLLRMLPRYQPETFPKNLQLVEAVGRLADRKGCTTAQLALCWLKSKSKQEGLPVVIPVAGARSEGRIVENAKQIPLTEDDLQEIEQILAAFPIEGYRSLPMIEKLNEY